MEIVHFVHWYYSLSIVYTITVTFLFFFFNLHEKKFFPSNLNFAFDSKLKLKLFEIEIKRYSKENMLISMRKLCSRIEWNRID